MNLHYVKLFLLFASPVLFTPIRCQNNCGNPLSTHVLNSVTGLNAANISCTVFSTDQFYEHTARCINKAFTDANGRVAALIPAAQFTPGTYLIRYRTNEFFSSDQNGSVFPYLEIAFNITDTCTASHIPLVISPFGYTTYEGQLLPPAPQ